MIIIVQTTTSARIDSDNKFACEASVAKSVSLEEGRKAFYQLREEAKDNGIQDTSLDEINAEISSYRSENR